MTDIFVSKGTIPTHSFDIWGPIFDAVELGKKHIELYLQIAADQNIDPETVKRVVHDYQGLCDGEPWATGKRKGEIIDALDGPINQSGLEVSYSDVFQEDGLSVMNEILDAGEAVIVFGSKPAPWLKQELPKEIGERMGDIYADDKTDPESFKRLFEMEKNLNRSLISHTADELPELEAAAKSGVFRQEGLIYVNRNDINPAEKVLAAGIGKYTNDLREVGYTKLATELRKGA